MIEEFNTPWMAFGGLELDKVRRIGSWVECWSGAGDVDVGSIAGRYATGNEKHVVRGGGQLFR